MTTPEEKITSLWKILRENGTSDYIGESISQLEHCLQAAYHAKQSGADDETVLAALLHDVGQFLPLKDVQEMQVDGVGSVGRIGHETIGKEYLLREGFSRKVAELVGAHVVAKRYLTAMEPGYLDALSSASKRSLEFQGGPFTKDQVEAFQKDPHWREKIALRKFDDAAKIVDLKVPDLDSYFNLGVMNLRAAKV